MKNLVLTAFLLFTIYFTSYSQHNQIKRIVLTWDFFKNDKPPFATHDALTTFNLTNSYKAVKIVGDKLIFKFNVFITLDTLKSYVNSEEKLQNLHILQHEQGHVDLAVIYARRLLKVLNDSTYTKQNYTTKIHKIYEDFNNQMDLENQKYDTETDHGKNNIKQDQWNLFFNTITSQ